APDEVRQHLPSLVELDDHRGVRHGEGRSLRAPYRRPAVDRAGACAPLPRERTCAAVGADHRGRVRDTTALAAALEEELTARAAVAERHQAAVRRDREPAAGPDRAVHHEVATLAFTAEAERLELADDLEREGVVELAHVDVGRAETRHPEGILGGASPDPPV